MARWSPPCPHQCWCRDSTMSSIADGLPTDQLRDSSEESTVPPIPQQSEDSVRLVICVQQHDTDVDTLLARLPPQTEAIKIIQAPDAPHIRLRSTHFRHFNNLRALSLAGAEVRNGSHPAMLLHSDSLRTTTGLEYFSAKNLELTDAPSHAAIDVERRELTEKAVHQSGLIPTNVTFEYLADEEEDAYEIVPYQVYQTRKLDDWPQEELWDGFVKLTKLKYLTISGCVLPDGLTYNRHSGALSTLVHLKTLVMESSQLRMSPSFSQGDLPELDSFSLADNLIFQLQKEDLQGLIHLRSLDLSRNNISHLAENSFPNLPRLESIDLRANPLRVIYPDAFRGLENLKSLQIGMWDLATIGAHVGDAVNIHEGSFDGLVHLHDLRMAPVAFIPHGLNGRHLQGLNALKEVHMGGRLNSVEADAFVDSRRLHILDLSHCQLTRLSMDAFQGLNKLRLLDLSYNQLDRIIPGLFDPLNSLKELWLNGNRLKTLTSDIFKPILAVTKLIRLEDNPWHCTCQLDQLRPTSVNKAKRMLPLSSDRSSVFVYDRKVTPRCQTPPEFEGSLVFDVMRRNLRCYKPHKSTTFASSSIRSHKRRALADWESYRLHPQQQDVVDHGPEASGAGEMPSQPEEIDQHQPELDYIDIVDHGPEFSDYVVVDETLQQNEVLVADKMQPPAPTPIPDYKRHFYSPSLSKKSLKLLKEQHSGKTMLAKKVPKIKKGLANDPNSITNRFS